METCYREDCAPRCERVHTEFIPLPCRVHAHPHPRFHPLPRCWIPVPLPNRIPAERIKIIFTHSRFTPYYPSFQYFPYNIRSCSIFVLFFLPVLFPFAKQRKRIPSDPGLMRSFSIKPRN